VADLPVILNRISHDGAIFENFIALQLVRACTIWNDTGLADAELHYARNFDGREIDFLITLNKEPVVGIEAKLDDDFIAEPQMNLARALGIPIIQVIRRPGVFRKIADTALVVAADRLLACLP
jgi:predicted AAA+ superfamily ATPase